MSCNAAGAVSMASFGETLKRERELREISLRQISEATKINIRYLEALEENRFDALPGGLFNKGFIRAYSTFIGVDGESMVNSYLHELAARQQGAAPAPARAASNLHRPAEVPSRRAAHVGGAAAHERAAAPAIALAAQPRRAPENRDAATGAGHEASHESAHAAAAGPARMAAQGTLDREADARPPAVTGIEVADSQAPASSRVLVWVLSLVAAAGVLFLILSLMRGTLPSPPLPAEAPPAHVETAPAPAGGEVVPPPDGGAAASGETSAVLPDDSSQSPISMGALTAPPPRAAPSSTPVQAAKPGIGEPAVVKPVAPAPHEAPPPSEPAGRVERAAEPREAREARGPMKVEIEALENTYVILGCDAEEVLNRLMEAGETERAKCDSVIRVSATDAGAVRLSVNGSACLPLGEPGTRAFGYTIRIDDFARICPSPGRGDHDRP